MIHQMVRLADKPTNVPPGSPLLPYMKTSEFCYDHSLVEESRPTVIAELWRLVEILRAKATPDACYHLHNMKGSWAGYKNCHIEGDMVLLFRYLVIDNQETLILSRLGTHAKLGI